MKPLLPIFIVLMLLPSAVRADRLYTIGFESTTITAGEEFTSSGLGGGWGSITATTSHSGIASLQNKPTTAANSWLGTVFRADGSTGKVFARCYVYIVKIPATNPVELCGFWDSVAVDRRASVVLTSTGVAQLLQDDNAQIGSDSATLPLNQWVMIEIAAEGTGAGNCDLEGKIDGVAFATSATATINDFNALYIGTPNATAAFEVYWDDLALNNTTATKGSTQTGYPGPGNIVYLHPSASGDKAADTGAFSDTDDRDPDDNATFVNLDNIGSSAYYNLTNVTSVFATGTAGTVANDATLGTIDWVDAAAGSALQDAIRWLDGGYTQATGIRVSGGVTDTSVKLIIGGTISGTSQHRGSTLTGTYEARVYGSPDNLWGTTPSYSDINASNFGFAFSMTGNGGVSKYLAATNFGFNIPSTATITGVEVYMNLDNPAGTPRADYLEMRVYYTGGAGTSQIDSYDTVTLVDAGIRIREEASAATSFQFGVKSQASGLVASSTAQDAGDTTWRTNQLGTTAMTNRMATTTDPQNNSAWTTTTLDSAQLGVASLDADNIDVSTLWLAVEYVDGTAPAGTAAPPQSVFFFE